MTKTRLKLITSLKIWIVIYPSITLFLHFLGDALSAFPLYIRAFILTFTLVPFIVFIGVPFIELILKTVSSEKEEKQINNDR